MIVLFGAEFTRQYTDIHSGGTAPAEHAKKEKPSVDEAGKDGRKVYAEERTERKK